MLLFLSSLKKMKNKKDPFFILLCPCGCCLIFLLLSSASLLGKKFVYLLSLFSHFSFSCEPTTVSGFYSSHSNKTVLVEVASDRPIATSSGQYGYLFHFYFSPIEFKFRETRDFCLFYSLLYHQRLEDYMESTWHIIGTHKYLLGELINELVI